MNGLPFLGKLVYVLVQVQIPNGTFLTKPNLSTPGQVTLQCNINNSLLTIVLQLYSSYPYLSGENLTPNLAFTSYVLINLLTEPLYTLPTILSNLVNAIVATRRLSKFFTQAEIEAKYKTLSNVDGERVPAVAFQNGNRYKVSFIRTFWEKLRLLQQKSLRSYSTHIKTHNKLSNYLNIFYVSFM